MATIEEVRTDLKDLSKEVGTLRERTASVETRIDGIGDQVESVDGKLSGHIAASGAQHLELLAKLNSVLEAREAEKKAISEQENKPLLGFITNSNAKIIGTLLGGILLAVLSALGLMVGGSGAPASPHGGTAETPDEVPVEHVVPVQPEGTADE